MPRSIFQDETRAKEAASIRDKLAQIESACQVIKAKAQEAAGLRTKWAAGVAKSEYDQADVDALDALTPKVAALVQAVNTYLA